MISGQKDVSVREMTASKAGLSRPDQVLIILRKIVANDGLAKMREIYSAVEEKMQGAILSRQGQASLRETVNRHAVHKEYINRDPLGWRITPKGRQHVESDKTTLPSGQPPVDIETKDMTDDEIDQAIKHRRLRIGIIKTDTSIALSRQRRGQQRIRELTLENYSSTCAFCDVSDPSLLVASHIMRWAEYPESRGILSNVICLCRFHDVLFEQGYLSLADDLTVLKTSAQLSQTVGILLNNTIHFRKPRAHPPEACFLYQHRLRCGL